MENIEAKIIKYLQEDLSAEDSKKIDQWRKENPENEKTFLDIEKIWKESNFSEAVFQHNFDTEKAWNKVKPKKKVKIKTLILGLSSAAVIAFLISISFKKKDKPVITEIIEIKTTDKTETILLPDSSEVILNKNSFLSYDKNLKLERKVFLRGEAFFKVEKNQNTFVVETENTEVTVLGTEFNVNTKLKDSTFVFVEEGKVAFSEKNQAKKPTILIKNQQGIFVKKQHKIIQNKNRSKNYIWYNNTFSFNHTSFLKVISSIEKQFKIQIIVEKSNLENEYFTAKIHNPTLEKIFDALKLTYNCEIIKTKEGYIIK
ncbi:FecR family protein [Aureivirga sp. CE67]|uniref:FecR family protein n=1 Tax=Aureivirga sp. CE67 TaxID=1788983 RepID=UPI0018C9C51B|nr:FecR family protein [Aureivirga sp. CE67]